MKVTDRAAVACGLFIKGSGSQYCQKVCAKTGVHLLHHKHQQARTTLQIHRPMSLGPISHICPMPPPIPPLNPRTLPSPFPSLSHGRCGRSQQVSAYDSLTPPTPKVSLVWSSPKTPAIFSAAPSTLPSSEEVYVCVVCVFLSAWLERG